MMRTKETKEKKNACEIFGWHVFSVQIFDYEIRQFSLVVWQTTILPNQWDANWNSCRFYDVGGRDACRDGVEMGYWPVRGTYKLRYKQSSDWLANSGIRRRICASRWRGISSSASDPVGATGANCGHTGEKRSARRVLFHIDGVTGGMYLCENRMAAEARQKQKIN